MSLWQTVFHVQWVTSTSRPVFSVTIVFRHNVATLICHIYSVYFHSGATSKNYRTKWRIYFVTIQVYDACVSIGINRKGFGLMWILVLSCWTRTTKKKKKKASFQEKKSVFFLWPHGGTNESTSEPCSEASLQIIIIICSNGIERQYREQQQENKWEVHVHRNKKPAEGGVKRKRETEITGGVREL